MNSNKFRKLYKHLRDVATCDQLTGEHRVTSIGFCEDIIRAFPEILEKAKSEQLGDMEFFPDEPRMCWHYNDFTGPYVTVEQWELIKDSLKANKKIQAIKAVREMTGMGLKESKGIVDAIGALSHDVE